MEWGREEGERRERDEGGGRGVTVRGREWRTEEGEYIETRKMEEEAERREGERKGYKVGQS